MPSPIPLPKNPPLTIDSIALSDWKLCVPLSESKKENNLFFIYSNFGIKKTKYENIKIKVIKKIPKNIILIPEVKI